MIREIYNFQMDIKGAFNLAINNSLCIIREKKSKHEAHLIAKKSLKPLMNKKLKKSTYKPNVYNKA